MAEVRKKKSKIKVCLVFLLIYRKSFWTTFMEKVGSETQGVRRQVVFLGPYVTPFTRARAGGILDPEKWQRSEEKKSKKKVCLLFLLIYRKSFWTTFVENVGSETQGVRRQVVILEPYVTLPCPWPEVTFSAPRSQS